MTERRDDDIPTAVSVGDGSLGGAAIGGSLLGPDAGEIHEAFGDDVAVPVGMAPDQPAIEGAPEDDARTLHEVDPSTDGRATDTDAERG